MVSQDLRKESFLLVSGEKGRLHRAIPYGFEGFDRFEQKVTSQMNCRLLTPQKGMCGIPGFSLFLRVF